MSIVTTFPFTNTANYTKVNTEVSGGAGRLALTDKPSQSFNQSFASSTGFSFDPAKSEFAAGVLRQKDRTAANSTMAAKYTSTANLNWHKSGGSTTGTLNGAPTISGGKLVCTGTQGVYYARNTATIETLKVKYTPNYTGAPPSNINILGNWNGTNNNDRFHLTHSPSGDNFRLILYNNAGSILISTVAVGGARNLVASTEYEIEAVIDSVAGTIRVFLDGVLIGTNSPGAWTRGTAASRYYVGASPAVYDRAEASFDDFIHFSNAQHTAGYTPGYSVADTIYGADTIDLPNFSYTGLGEIQSLDNLTTTEGNSPRYTFEGQYWNGSAWVASDGSYAQANGKATAIANLPTLDMSGQTVVSLQVVWQDQNTQGSVDDLTLEYTGQFYPLEGTLLTNPAFVARDLSVFSATENKPANTEVRYAVEVNSVCMYWNGSAWAVSDCTSAEANLLADIQANIDTLLTVNSSVKLLVVLTTTDQEVTPEIDTLSVTYDFGALEPGAPTQCQVFGFLKDSEDQPIVGATVSAVPNRSDDEYKEAADRIIAKTISKTTDANGFFSMNLIISDDFEVGGAQAMRYVLSIAISGQTLPVFKNGGDNTTILFEVPNQASVNITDQIGAI